MGKQTNKKGRMLLAVGLSAGILLGAVILAIACIWYPAKTGKSFWESLASGTGAESQTEESGPETAGTENGEDGAGAEMETESETETETEAVPEPVVTEITISAVGDVTLGTNQTQGYSNSFHSYYDNYGADYFLQNVREIFQADDFTIANLEGTLTDSTNIRESKQWNHKGKPEYVNILTGGSIEAVSLGNNHIMDYEQDGVNDTIANLSNAGIAYALNGDWGNHLGTYETKGITIGFVSVNEYYDGKRVYSWMEEGYNTLREQGADIVIAAMHWGGDKVHELEQEQRDLGHWLVDLGYDLVLGCHPHVLQGIEQYNGTYIVYSMGNFCYGGSSNPKEKESMIFQGTFTFVDGVMSQDPAQIRVIPCQLSSVTSKNDYCPIVLTGDPAQTLIDHMNSYSAEFGLKFNAEGYLEP